MKGFFRNCFLAVFFGTIIAMVRIGGDMDFSEFMVLVGAGVLAVFCAAGYFTCQFVEYVKKVRAERKEVENLLK